MAKDKSQTPPEGMSIIRTGVVKTGDFAFSKAKDEWKRLQDTEAGQDISDYVAVARDRRKIDDDRLIDGIRRVPSIPKRR